MAEGLSSTIAQNLLDLLFNATAYAGQATVYAKLHVGAPGAAGTSNAAVETTRKAVTMGAASGGAISNDAAVDWTAVAGTEDYTHVSLWTAAVAGTFIMSGTITANAVTAGDNFSLPIGDIDVTMPVAS